MSQLDWKKYTDYFDRLGSKKENIVLVNNFIENDDLIKIQNYLKKYENDNEFMGGKDIRQEQIKKENLEIYEILIKYEEKIFKEIEKLFIQKYNIPVKRDAVNSTHFVKWVEGMNSKLHCDCQKPDGSPALAADFFKYNVSVLMYPNDDYEGGQITFPEYDLKIKPKAGDMILFPGNMAYLHTVEVITKGIRYTMPSWYTYDIDVEPNNKDWSYVDSMQLWPEEDGLEPVGLETHKKYLNENKKGNN